LAQAAPDYSCCSMRSHTFMRFCKRMAWLTIDYIVFWLLPLISSG
jgi:hypothetical protein